MRVLVYSDNSAIRSQVIGALGLRPHPSLPEIEFVEVATYAAVIAAFDAGDIALAVLDGEATPAGGFGIAKQISDEIDTRPPILVLTGRSADAWLARWSRADAAVPRPVDPIRLAAVAVRLLSMAGYSEVVPVPRAEFVDEVNAAVWAINTR